MDTYPSYPAGTNLFGQFFNSWDMANYLLFVKIILNKNRMSQLIKYCGHILGQLNKSI